MKRFVVVLLSLVPTLVWAEAIDFQTALQEAVSSRPFVEAAQRAADAANYAVGEAKSRYFPRVSLSENFLWTDEPATSLFISLNQEDLQLYPTADPYNDPPSRKDFETRLSVDQVLFDPDVYYGHKRAEKGAEAALENAQWAKEEAGFAVFRAYLNLQQAKGTLGWAESARRQAEEVLRLAASRKEAGLGLKADELRAQVFLSEALRREVTAANDVELAKNSLVLAMGRERGDIDIENGLTPEDLSGQKTRELTQRADLKAMSLKSEGADMAYRQSKAAYLPKVGMGASYSFHDGAVPLGTEAESWTVHAGLTWELFDGFRRSNSKGKAAAERDAAEFQRLEAARAARNQLDEAKRRAEEARMNLQTARQSVSQGEESLRLLQDRYAEGLTNMADLLSAQTALEKARFDALRADNQLLLALGNILFQQGTFVQSFLPSEESHP